MSLDATDPTWINSPDEATPPMYNAEELRRNMAGLLAPGATVGAGRGGALDPRSMVVSIAGSNVQCSAGPYAVESTSGAYLTGLPTAGTVDPLTPADGTNPRRDRVVLQIQDPDNGSNDPAAGSNRKAVVRYLTGTPSPNAGTGVGMPALPNLAEDLAWIDVPKNGSGAPTVTDKRRFSVASGAPVPVANATEMNALPKYRDALCYRRDRKALYTCDGSSWGAVLADGAVEYGFLQPSGVNFDFYGTCTVTPQADGRKRVDGDLLITRKSGGGVPANPMSPTRQNLGVVLPTAARGSNNSKIFAAGYFVGTGVLFIQVAPAGGQVYIWGLPSNGTPAWAPGDSATANFTYYL